MTYKLKKGIFKIKCRYDNCPFEEEIDIQNSIMGITEDDVENEAKKIAIELANTIHDLKHSKNHVFTKPEINKVSVIYEALTSRKSSINNQEEAIKYKEYKKGEKILNKGDIAITICEVVKGHAYPNKNKSHLYNVGDSFGAAALLVNQSRTIDIISGEEGTTIAFYNLKELNKKDPRKAKELYIKAMEDFFNVVAEMEDLIGRLEKEIEEEEIKNNNLKEEIRVNAQIKK